MWLFILFLIIIKFDIDFFIIVFFIWDKVYNEELGYLSLILILVIIGIILIWLFFYLIYWILFVWVLGFLYIKGKYNN